MPAKKAFKPAKRRPSDPVHNGRIREEALRRLRASWEVENTDAEWKPEKEPVITPMLKAASGGLDAVLSALRSYAHDDAQKFIHLYDDAPKRDRKVLPIETFAFASGIGSIRLAGLAAEAIVSTGHTQTQILMGSAMHKVMRSTIKAATDEVPITAEVNGVSMVVGKTNGDTRAQEMFHKMTGMMPIPKGSQIAIQNVYRGAYGQGEAEAPTQGWRSPDERLREIYAITEQKQIEAPKEIPSIITGRGSVEFEHAR